MGETKVVLFAVVALTFCVGAIVYTGSSLSCKAKANKMGLEYDWSFSSGCMVKVKQAWIPLKSYRYIEKE